MLQIYRASLYKLPAASTYWRFSGTQKCHQMNEFNFSSWLFKTACPPGGRSLDGQGSFAPARSSAWVGCCRRIHVVSIAGLRLTPPGSQVEVTADDDLYTDKVGVQEEVCCSFCPPLGRLPSCSLTKVTARVPQGFPSFLPPG